MNRTDTRERTALLAAAAFAGGQNVSTLVEAEIKEYRS